MRFVSAFYALLFSAIIICTDATAQEAERTYYNTTWKKCDPTKAYYVCDVLKTDSGYYRKNFFVSNGTLQMAALYEDGACKTLNGSATYLYANGRVQRQVRMMHGKTEGVEMGYYYNGVISDSGSYRNGDPVGATFRWHINGTMSDSVAASNDSVRVHVSWFDDGSPAAAGREIKGKPTGVWIYYHRNGSRAAKEMYEKGKRISVQHFDENGNEIPLDTSRNERVAVFKGGTKGWGKYMERALVWPEGYSFPNMEEVVLQIQMTIDEEGKVKDVYLVNPVHPAFDKVAYNAISKSPAWEPAIQHNRPVKFRFQQSVTFVQPQ